MNKGYIFYFVPETGYVIEEFNGYLSSHRQCIIYATAEDAQTGINQLIMQ